MIGRDEPYALVIINRSGTVSEVIQLGNATLESWEMDKVQDMLSRHGRFAHLMNVVEVDSFHQILIAISDRDPPG